MMRRFLTFAAILGFVTTASVAAQAASLVVISSQGAGLKVGAVIDGRTPISLRRGASVAFVSADGRTLKLSGPYSGPPDPSGGAQDSELLVALSGIVARSGNGTSSAGIMRSSLYASSNPWVIDVGRTGSHCVRTDRPVLLWRAMAFGGASASLRSNSLGRTRVKWESGNYEAHWPQDLAVRDGETYRLRYRASMRSRHLTIHLLPQDLPNDASRVVWMHRKGCVNQARSLLTQMRG